MARLSDEVVAAGLREMIKLRNGGIPPDDELERAPLLTEWLFVDVDGRYVRLGGFVTGHPAVGPGWCWTSIVVFVAPDRTWARTISRYYRLGRSMPFDGG